MKTSLNYKLFWVPIFIIGLVLIVLGPGWMLSSEPWLLDKAANEEILGISFNELLGNEANSTLPEYLRTIYSFFGLWVLFLGVFIISSLLHFDLNDFKLRNMLHLIISVLLIICLYFGHTKIPNSPFIYLMWFFVFIMAVSIFASFKLRNR